MKNFHDLLVPGPPARSLLNGIADIQGFHFYGVSAPSSHTLPPPSRGDP